MPIINTENQTVCYSLDELKEVHLSLRSAEKIATDKTINDIQKENAKLIATAPDMYRVLITIQQEGGLSQARHRQITRILDKVKEDL